MQARSAGTEAADAGHIHAHRQRSDGSRQAKGVDLVIADQRPDFPENLDSVNVDQLRGLINSRNVLFFKPQIDISADVFQSVEREVRKGAISLPHS